jgi:hypothetical protein
MTNGLKIKNTICEIQLSNSNVRRQGQPAKTEPKTAYIDKRYRTNNQSFAKNRSYTCIWVLFFPFQMISKTNCLSFNMLTEERPNKTNCLNSVAINSPDNLEGVGLQTCSVFPRPLIENIISITHHRTIDRHTFHQREYSPALHASEVP